MESLTYASLKHGLSIAGLFSLLFITLAWSVRSDEEWRLQLASKQITTYSLSERERTASSTIDLCPGGEYTLLANGSIASGSWNVSGGFLQLRSDDGAILKEYELYQGMDPDMLVLDGEANRLSPDAVCR